MASLHLSFTSGACSRSKKMNYDHYGLILASNKPVLQTTNNYKYSKKTQMHENQLLLQHSFLEPSRNGTRTVKCIHKIGAMKKRGKAIRWRVWCNDDGSCGIVPQFNSTPSTIHVINEFFESVNSKNNDKLKQLLSDDCELQDLVFYIPFVGKKEVLGFIHEVMDAMGHSVRFRVESITEGENFTAVVMWHLDWDGKALPFTTGYSFFQCTEVDGQLVIRRIKGVEELPLKPGDLLLKLLKAATTLFDNMPIAAKGFLAKSSDFHEALRMFRDVLGIDHDHHGKS